MNIIRSIRNHFIRKKLIVLESKVSGLSAKLKRTEELAKVTTTVKFDLEAINITQELWESKRMLQLLSEEISK